MVTVNDLKTELKSYGHIKTLLRDYINKEVLSIYKKLETVTEEDLKILQGQLKMCRQLEKELEL